MEKVKHFLKLVDLSIDELSYLFDRAKTIKANYKSYKKTWTLEDRTLVMIFEKASTRCGLDAPDTGLAYPLGSIDDLPNLMRPRAQGGVLDGEGMVEVLNSLNDDGSEIDYDIRMGVWVSVRAETEYQRKCFEEYKVTTDDSGQYICAYKRWHLIGLELGLSVANVGLRGEATGTAEEFRADVVAVAKRGMEAGDILDGEGGYTVAGQLRPSAVSVPMGALPLGLTGKVKLTRPVKADAILTYDDVEIDENLTAVKLRRKAESRFLPYR